MYNIKGLLENKKKIILFLSLIVIGLTTLGISLIPTFNYKTGENLAERSDLLIPMVYVGIYSIFALIIIGIIAALNVISKKVYVVKRIDDSIKNIKKGRSMESTGPKRNELLQSHFAERIRASGMNTNRLKLFDRVTEDERNSIVRFRIDGALKNNSDLD
ncbi:MAG: hypothetical protein ACTSUE_26740 [Promethearchaeota archaeon]